MQFDSLDDIRTFCRDLPMGSAHAAECAGWLSEQGIVARLAGTGEAALAALAEFRPDLVLIADGLPDARAFELAQMVRLVDDLLDLNRITHDRLELRRSEVELSSVVQQAVEVARPLVDACALGLERRVLHAQLFFGDFELLERRHEQPGNGLDVRARGPVGARLRTRQ